MRLALVGAGNIADRYAAAIGAAPELELAGATDLDGARAEALVVEHGGCAYADLDAVLADDGVDTVVNLTVPQAHFEVAAAALAAGKHVHSEKPLALAYEDAHRLLELAGEHGVRLSSAPTTLLGEAQQTLWKHVRDGAVGTVRAVYAEANWDRIERWHPDPRSLYAVGPLVDVGVYPLTIVTAMFGPVRLVRAYATTLEPERALLDGTAFTPGGARLHRRRARARVRRRHPADRELLRRAGQAERDRGARRRGLAPPAGLDGGGLAARAAAARRRVRGDPAGARAVQGDRLGSCARRPRAARSSEGRPHRAAGEHAAHVVEVLNAVESSAGDGGAIAVTSEFTTPEPMDWAR